MLSTKYRQDSLARFALVFFVLAAIYIPTEGGGRFGFGLRYFSTALLLYPIIKSPQTIQIRLSQIAWFTVFGGYVLVINGVASIESSLLMLWVFASSIAVVSIWSSPSRDLEFIKAIDALIYVLVASLVLQIVIYLATGRMLDLHNMIFPFSESRFFQAQNTVWRFTGLQIEPGTYSNWIYALVLLRVFFSKNAFSGPVLVGLFSILLTLSFWGLVAVSAYGIAYALRNLTSKEVAKTLLVIGLILTVATILLKISNVDLLEYVLSRLSTNDTSSGAKLQAYNVVSAAWSEYLFLGKPFGFDYCDGCDSRQDAGIILAIYVSFGGVLLAALLLSLARGASRIVGAVSVLMLLPFFFGKYGISDYAFWLVAAKLLSTFRFATKSEVRHV